MFGMHCGYCGCYVIYADARGHFFDGRDCAQEMTMGWDYFFCQVWSFFVLGIVLLLESVSMLMCFYYLN